MTTDKKTDARKLDHATLEAMRFRAIEATKAGMKATDLALAYGVHRRTSFAGWPTSTKAVNQRSRPSRFRVDRPSPPCLRCSRWLRR